MSAIRLEDFTYLELKKKIASTQKAGVILPIGCTEQHGPILPVSCDTIIARGAAENLARNLNKSDCDFNAYVLPDFAYTPSPGAENIPGTISVSFDWMGQGIKEIIRSVIKTGWKFCVILNGHAQNVGRVIETSMAAAQGELGRQFPVIVINAYEFGSIFNKYQLTPSSHAGEAEIALYNYYSGKKIENNMKFQFNEKMRGRPTNIFGLSILDRSHNGILTEGPVDINKAMDVSTIIGNEMDSLILEKIINNLNIYFKEWASTGEI